MSGQVLVVGVGNRYRRDDGVGLVTAGRLRLLVPAGVHVVTHEGEPLSLLALWQAADAVWLVDAAAPAGAPGTVHRFEASDRPLSFERCRCSTHALDLAEIIELARALGVLPPRLIVYGIEGADFGVGEGLSPAVTRASEVSAARIRGEIATLWQKAGEWA